MFSDTLWLTIATILGLALGFLRELTLLDRFGASAGLDAFIIALFLPEAVRIVLGGGALAAAILPMWLACEKDQRSRWSGTQTMQLTCMAALVSSLLMLTAPWVVTLLAPGMTAPIANQAADFFAITIWCLPAVVLHAILATIHQAEKRFFIQGLAGVFFNTPALCYLLITVAPDLRLVAWCMVLGSMLMPLPLLPGAWRAGWRPFTRRLDFVEAAQLYRRLRPLILASAANQSVVWVERAVASLLGEGVIVLINLARKLINILSVVLMSLGQVLLSHFSHQDHARASALLQNTLRWLLILFLPVVSVAILFARPLIAIIPLKLAANERQTLAWLVMGFAATIPLASLNMVFARWRYGHGDTVSSTKVELFGMALQTLFAFVLSHYWGILAIPAAAFIATTIMAWLFVQRKLVPLQLRQFLTYLVVIIAFSAISALVAPAANSLKAITTLLLCALTALLLSSMLYFLLRPDTPRQLSR